VIVYGRNPVHEALRGGRAGQVSDIWATSGAAREEWLAGREPRIASAGEIAERCGSDAHQGVCADAGPYHYAHAEQLLARERPLLVVLDQVQDPQNLGSIARTAECAGADGVVIAQRRSAEVTPAVCKASAGAVEHLPLARVRNIADFIIEAREAGCWSYGAFAPQCAEAGLAGGTGISLDPPSERPGSGTAAAGRERVPVPYDAPDYAGAGVLLVLGSEGHGLRPRVAAACDELVALPMRGKVQSLGVSAAAAALLYEILQNRAGPLDNAS
jgi:23S rRNA (guanosine2251-2'-O)-methyltransferase